MEGLLEEVKKFEPRIIELRRRVHEQPELAYHEVKTARLVAKELRSLGVEVRTGVGGTGVLGVLKGRSPGKVVALRADMDALPVEEMVNLPFKSKGRGGHGSAPHETVDPIFVAAQVIVALQGISSRMIDPVKPFVISVCSIHSGTKSNIIPDEAVLEGTIRTLDDATRRKAVAKVREVAQTVAKAFGASSNVEFIEDPYPITFNDVKVTREVAEKLRKIDGMKVVEMDPILGGEDFSRFLQKAPGTFYYLGTLNKK